MCNNSCLIKISHILQPAIKVISHVLINSETVKEVNNHTEDTVFTSSESLISFHKPLNANSVTILVDTIAEKNGENKLKYFVLACEKLSMSLIACYYYLLLNLHAKDFSFILSFGRRHVFFGIR